MCSGERTFLPRVRSIFHACSPWNDDSECSNDEARERDVLRSHMHCPMLQRAAGGRLAPPGCGQPLSLQRRYLGRSELPAVACPE
jgi:hypothetical protein